MTTARLSGFTLYLACHSFRYLLISAAIHRLFTRHRQRRMQMVEILKDDDDDFYPFLFCCSVELVL